MQHTLAIVTLMMVVVGMCGCQKAVSGGGQAPTGAAGLDGKTASDPFVRAGPNPGAGARLRLDYKVTKLDNGLEVITLEDFTAPVVNVQLWYHVGSKDEDPRRQGFAHMFEHMMFRGTDRLGATDHFDLIRKTGGWCNAYTAFDQTVYHEMLPANQLELALWLESERMAWLKIDQKSFDTERQVVEEERRQMINQPYGTVPEKLLAEVLKVHPYRWTPIGSIPDLRAASVPELRAFWTRYYVPNNAKLVIVGSVTHARAQELARKYFGWIPRYADPPRITVREPELTTGPKSLVFNEDNAPAPVVAIGCRTVAAGDKDEIPLDVLGSIIGGGQSSRAYRQLVAEKELAMTAMGMTESIEQDGFFAVGAVLSPIGGRPADAMAALEAILERVRTEPVSERELKKVRNQMLYGMVEESLTVRQRASALGRAAVLDGDVAHVNTRLEQVRAVTAADLQRVAQKYLAPERLYKVTVQSNLVGTLGGLLGFKKAEEAPPVTALPEINAPPPGRDGTPQRPASFPTTAPVAQRLAYDPTLKYESATLANGMTLFVVENHKAPLVRMNLKWRAGAWTDAKPGTAAMALAMLSKGTKEHTEGQLAEELETYAIALSGAATMDDSTVAVSCLTEHLDRAAGLMAEVIRTPTFPEKEFGTLRKQVLTDLAVSANEPAYVANREFRRRIYGSHPYARTVSGEVEDVNALTVDDAAKWWQLCARPDTATLIFEGDIDLARARAVAEARFGDWHVDRVVSPAIFVQVPPAQPTHIYLVDRPGVQSQIRVGAALDFTRKSPGFFASRVVSGYFGGGFGSRINEGLRVKKGLTYGAGGGYGVERFASTFQVSTFTKNARTPETVRAILDEIGRLKAEPPSADELDKTISWTLGSFLLQLETPGQPTSNLWLIKSQDLPTDFVARLLSGVAATTAPECLRLVNATVDPAKLTIVVVGPAVELRQELEKIAPVTVITSNGTKPGSAPTTQPQ